VRVSGVGVAIASSFERAPWGWGLFAMVALALIKGWPAISDAVTRARIALAEGRKSTIDDLRDRIVALEGKVEHASTAAHAAEMKLVYAVSAVQLLAARIRAENPDDPSLKQAMELLSAATTGGLPSWAPKLASGLDSVRGAGE
jgi:hypothetical protein